MPIRDPSCQKQVWAEIVVWLDINEPDSEQPSLQFLSITVNSFRALFRRLVVLANPTYKFPPSHMGLATEPWDTEFKSTLSALSYLFHVNTDWISQPSETHVWPFLLSIGEWLLNQGKVRAGHSIDGPPALWPCLIDSFPLDFRYGNGELDHQFLSHKGYNDDIELEDIMGI